MRGDPADERQFLYGLHPVLEALEANLRSIDRILVAREGQAPGLGRILRTAREAGIPVSHVPREVLARQAGRRAVHQGIAAIVSAGLYADPDDICREAARSNGMVVALDGVTDPGNLGAIVRTVAGAGAAGILLSAERTVGLTPAVAKTSAGMLERVQVGRVAKLGRRLEALKEEGFRVIALDSQGHPYSEGTVYTGRLVFVAGGEESGLRSALREVADRTVAVPLASGVDSLNVSVAVGIVLFEAVRQRHASRNSGN